MITPEKVSQTSMTGSRRSVHQTFFLWGLLYEFVRSTTQRLVVPSGSGFPFSEIRASRPRLVSFSRVLFES
jgi:hypothetical protein